MNSPAFTKLEHNRPHNPKVFGPPEKTQWKPVGAITKAVSDGDMTTEDAGTLSNFLEQSTANLTPANLELAVTEMAAACAMFD